MSWSSDYPPPKHQHGWDTTSHDYHAHLQRIEREPSVLTDVPHYPNVHRVFNNKVVTYEEEDHGSHHKNHHKNQTPRFAEKVEVIEKVEVREHEEYGNNGNFEVHEETLDVEADGYIQKKHKGFELCKWKSFKAH